MKRQYKIFDFRMYEHKELEAYLTSRARKGWQLKQVHSIMMCEILAFEKAEPFEGTYHVDYTYDFLLDKKQQDEEAKERYLDFMAEYGYEHVCDLNALSIFRKEGDASMPILEESAQSQAALRKAVIQRDIRGHLCLPFFLLFMTVVDFDGILPYLYLPNLMSLSISGLLLVLYTILSIVLYAWYCLPCMRWLFTGKAHSSIKRIRRFSILEATFYSLLILTLFIDMIFLNVYIILLYIILSILSWLWFRYHGKQQGALDQWLIIMIVVFIAGMLFLSDHLNRKETEHKPYFTSSAIEYPLQDDFYTNHSVENPLVRYEEMSEGNDGMKDRRRSDNFWYQVYEIKDSRMSEMAVKYILSYYQARLVKQEDGLLVYKGKKVKLYRFGHHILVIPDKAIIEVNEIKEVMNERK